MINPSLNYNSSYPTSESTHQKHVISLLNVSSLSPINKILFLQLRLGALGPQGPDGSEVSAQGRCVKERARPYPPIESQRTQSLSYMSQASPENLLCAP